MDVRDKLYINGAWVPSTGKVQWSEESYRITGIDRGTAPSLDEIILRTLDFERKARAR